MAQSGLCPNLGPCPEGSEDMGDPSSRHPGLTGAILVPWWTLPIIRGSQDGLCFELQSQA